MDDNIDGYMHLLETLSLLSLDKIAALGELIDVVKKVCPGEYDHPGRVLQDLSILSTTRLKTIKSMKV